MKNNWKWKRVIGVYQILGGALGLGVIATFIPDAIQQFVHLEKLHHKIFLILIILYVFGAYLLTFLAGLLLWERNQKGVIPSIIVQTIQIPRFTIAGFTYVIVAGLEVYPQFSNSSMSAMSYFGSHFRIHYTPGGADYMIGVNILALIMLIYLVKDYKKNKRNKNECALEVKNEQLS